MKNSCALIFLFQLWASLQKAVSAPIELTVAEFYTMMQNGEFDAVVDVRRQDEWDEAHIEGAYFVESLASYSASSMMMMSNSMTTGSPSDLAGCEYCNIAVYCRSGSRARSAIGILENNGFKGMLYNGQGVMQWANATYPLVNNTDPIPPPCTLDQTVSDQCKSKLEMGEMDDEESSPGVGGKMEDGEASDGVQAYAVGILHIPNLIWITSSVLGVAGAVGMAF
mmetsp:Transcript_1135/g.2505  ORF Transcript_1135/g.2505 Transcript_1135/m.2505 type:complete len:224 (+) Transcript_1135:139-810(+)